MKTTRIFLLAALGLAAAAAARAFDPVKGLPHTDVIFFEPGKFTDVSDRMLGNSDKERDETLGQLRTDLIKQANHWLAPGQKLKITVTDVDLAGEYEPWHGPELADVRIVKDIYPPDIKLSFQLTDADGTVLKQGDRHLRDMGFMMTLSIDQNDPLRYEKEMLDNWLRDEFRGLKAR